MKPAARAIHRPLRFGRATSTEHFTPATEDAHAFAGVACGRFRIVRSHAKGGLGEVFVADDSEVHRSVALKRILNGHGDDADSRARFLREAEITGKLEHPGIVPIYGMGTDSDGRPYYAMRFIEGESLRDSLARFHDPRRCWKNAGERQLELRKLLQRFLDVCNAIEYAHSRGVIHRDLKPANIMVGKYGETLVVDWGLAKPIGSSDVTEPDIAAPQQSPHQAPTKLQLASDEADPTAMGIAVGTPVYMSPEQASGRHDRLFATTDVYALGAVLFTILAGKPPVKGTSFADVLERVRTGKLEPLPATIAKPLASICRHALALKPEDRYLSARALADDVEKWLADERVTVHRESLGERSARWARTHRVAVASAIALTVTTVVALVVGLLFVSAEQRKTALEKQVAEDRRQEAETARAGETTARKLADAARATAEQRKTEADEQRRLAENKQAEAESARVQEATERKRADEQRDKAEWTAYVAHIQAADAEWERNQVASAQSHLMACPLKLRGWEHAYLTARFQRGQRNIWGMAGPVRGICYSPDGKYIAGGGHEGNVKVWDAASGKLLRTFGAYRFQVNSVAFVPGTPHLVSGSLEGKLTLWDVETGTVVKEFADSYRSLGNIAVSPDGKRMLTGGAEGLVRGWDIATGKETPGFSFKPNSVAFVKFSPYGTRIAIGLGSGTFMIKDAKSGETLHESPGTPFSLGPAAFSPDGRKIAFGTGAEQVVKLRDADTGNVIFTLSGHTSAVNAVAFSRDGKYIASGSTDQTVRLWSAETGLPLRVFRGHTTGILGVDFSADGRQIVSGSNHVKIWDIDKSSDAQNVMQFESGGARHVCFSGDGKLMAVSGDRSIKVWDLELGRETKSLRLAGQRFGPEIFNLAFVGGNERIAGACSDGVIRVWDFKSRQQPSAYALSPNVTVAAVAVSSDVRYMAGLDRRNVVKAWNLSTGAEIWSKTDSVDDLTTMSLSPDACRLLLASGRTKTAKLWDARTGEELQTLGVHDFPVHAAVFNRQGSRIATADEAIKLWDADTGKHIRSMQTNRESVRTLAFSPDGKRLVAGFVFGLIKIWDVETGAELLALRGQTGAPTNVEFSSDGRFLACSAGKYVRLWDSRLAD